MEIYGAYVQEEEQSLNFSLFTRHQFTLCEEIFFKLAIIPENEIGIRPAVLKLSLAKS